MKNNNAADTLTLPGNYEERAQIDLQKNKKQAVLVNVLALLTAAALVVVGALLVPLREDFLLAKNAETVLEAFAPALRFLAVIAGMIAYLILHELVHGIFMRSFSGVRPRYGFTGLYAYAGSDAFFGRRHYIVIALAPVVIWGVVLLALTALMPQAYFWYVYLIQIINLSGAAGDLYVTARMLRMPEEILVRDTGVSMTVFAPKA